MKELKKLKYVGKKTLDILISLILSFLIRFINQI